MTGLPIYLFVALTWFGAAAAWYWAAAQAGKAVGAPNDGCLLGVGNIFLALVGGGLGFLVAPYPWSLLTSLMGTILLPGLATGFFLMKNRR